MSVLSHTQIITGGTDCLSSLNSLKVFFHSLANVVNAPSASLKTDSGLGFLFWVARSDAEMDSLIVFHNWNYFGIGCPELSSTGTRGIFTIPHSMASTRPKSDASH